MNENIQAKPKKVRKFKPNIIDFLIVIIIIGAIVGIVLRTGIVEQVTINNNLEKARVSFRIADISEGMGNYFGIGDVFYSETHKTTLGTLETYSIMPAEVYIVNQNGELIKTNSINGRIDVRGVIVCDGVFTEDGFLLGGSSYIAPNSEITVKTSSLNVTLTVTDIEKVADNNQ